MMLKLFSSLATLSLAAGHNDSSLGYSQSTSSSSSVPGPPEWATLKVLGSNSLQTKFAPPLWDGGSPITSYLVEWDKEAGIPEVQRITTSQNLNANEIQTITTSVPPIHEIQVIRTSATPRAEVQAVTVSPPTGDTTIDSAYSFALSLDTINTGGSLQYSGQISANADADGSRSSIAEIIENMANVHGRPTVERAMMNADGGHTYLITFPVSMGNVPEMEVFMTDLPVSVSTVEEGNVLGGSFRLEFMGDLTADIPFDASSAEMQHHLESIDSIGALSVTRSVADEQGGFTWDIEFLSVDNAGNLDPIIVHGDGLVTSNMIGGALIQNSGGIDGSYISGSFTLSFRGPSTNPIPFDADSSTIKDELEALPTIARVAVERTSLDILGGCTWTIYFLEDETRLHRGDMPMIQVDSSLIGALGQTPTIVVAEERKGTKKEVQTISVDGGGNNVDPTSAFKLKFEDDVTGDIPALPMGGTTCLGSTKAKQIITTSTVDTSGMGGDDSVSHLTSFALTYEGYTTSKIMANAESCEMTSHTIASELIRLPPLYEVDVTGTDTSAGDEGCSWTVTFLSAVGNPELMTVAAFNSDVSAGPGYSVTLGDEFSIIQDTIVISQPDDFKGDINLIQSELSKLSSIGVVTVSPQSAVPDSFGQCVWEVTFESKAGNVPSIEVAQSGTDSFSTLATLNSGNIVTVTDNTVRGTSIPISGDFRLEFDGEVTGYMPHNASPEEMKAALDSLNNIGHVSVTRIGPDVNRCYTWDITFVSDLGPLPLIVPDGLDLRGTVASMSVSKATGGILPPFNGPDYGSHLITDNSDLSLVIPKLKQGIPYYVRISASSQVGSGPSIMPYPPFETPYPQPPTEPLHVDLESLDGSSLAVSLQAPFHDGGEDISTYRVDYSTKPFAQERQRVSLTCNPQSEIQSITTSAADINEVQYLVIDSSYSGNGEVLEVQQVLCDATGGTFGLSFGGETAYISHDDGAQEIKEAIESLSLVDSVSVTFNNGGLTACMPHDGIRAGDFSITFQSLFGVSGDLPQMTTETSGLDGARRVEVTTVVDGDAALSGSLKLSFRGATTEAIDVSADLADLANDINTALEALDTIQQNGVSVSAVTLDNGGFEKMFGIEFQGDGVGGNVEPIVVVPEHLLISGSSADAFILSDGESYAARNGLDSIISVIGNELSGNFRLKLRGHTTDSITFNASVDQVKERLEQLPNIGEVDVQMSGPSKEMAYSWVVTFLSNPGYFPPSTRDVDLLETINELSTSVETDTSAHISVETVRNGDDRLKGVFTLSFNDGTTIETTRPLESFISADDLKVELEALPNIGRVNVVRSQSLVNHEWDIEFASCALKNGVEICNDGNLLDLVASSINLRGCGGTELTVIELTAGSGPDETCHHIPNGICSDEMPFGEEYPVMHSIRDLTLGTPYYVQARFRNSQSYGYRTLSIPSHVIPRHNPPGSPPPVVMKESSSTSITLGWSKPTENGGKQVSGYELWMDSWNGGETVMVYDGSGSPDVLEYRLTTDNAGPHSQVVETGRQYRFQVRAINNCDTTDQSRACYGDFSEVQIFTVRDPRPPLPPSMPTREARTRVTSSNEASISISWSSPIDNGGSPITGYIVYMRDPDGTVTSRALGSDTTSWQEDGLHPGEVYRFHVVAINDIGKSGNSAVLSTLAAVAPGLNYIGKPKHSSLDYRPIITEVHETSLNIKWSRIPADISGGSPITGFKLYRYKDVKPLAQYDADPILQEVQHIRIISSESALVSGTFTVSFRGFETRDISVDATGDELRAALENLHSINFVSVESISNGWTVTFLSEAGDLPLMEATSGRLLGDANAKVVVTEETRGDPATLIYDGSESPATLTFEALDLTPDLGYAFKVAPFNSVGDGILSAASIVTVARSGASALKTTASGSALTRGIAGWIREEQTVTFLSNDCDVDKLVLSFEFSEVTDNLCGSTEHEFELAVEGLSGVGDVHVSRDEYSIAGHIGYSWSVTFNSKTGDVPLLSVDLSQVGGGVDSSGSSGSDAEYLVEFLKGQANEFTIEPKKASGSVVKDISTHAGMEGGDVFFTELWTSDPSIVDGSHTWYSDGGVSRYNRLLYEEQVITIPDSVGPFFLAMDTSEDQPNGRIDGEYSQTTTFHLIEEVNDVSLQEAFSDLPNVGKVDVTRIREDHELRSHYAVTFKDVYGEMPLVSASDPSITISRNGGQYSSTEVQSITISADKPFVYEVQSIVVESSCSTFDISFMGSSRTNSISCNFADTSEFTSSALVIEDELNALPNVKARVDAIQSATGDSSNPWEYEVTFLEPVGPLPLLDSDNVKISQVVQGESTLSGSFVLSYEGEYTGDIRFDASARDVKSQLESLVTIEEVDVKRVDKYTGYQWAVSFTGNAGNLPLLIAHNDIFEVQSIETTGGQPTPLGGSFTLSYLSETTSPIPHDGSAEIVKSSLEALPSIYRVDVSQKISEYGQSQWLVTYRSPSNPALLKIDSKDVSGTLENAVVSIEIDSEHPSLLVQSGAEPDIVIEEKIAGRPSYTGQYIANAVGSYTLAVMQLENGGLNAKYYDNQWLLDEPVIERIDSTVNFDWGSGIITQYGRDYISARWWGKVLPTTTELYTFYLIADDGARLYIDHDLVIDLWDDENIIEKKASVALNAETFHDVKIEYKEITGDANIRLQWSTRSIRKQVIPSSQLYYTSHIVGSPFLTTVSPGAADYPYSTFIDDANEGDRTIAIAGESTYFYLQAKDSSGNNKLTNGDAQGDMQSPEEQFTVDIIRSHGSVSGNVVYMNSGQYRVDYTALKAGSYQVHVKTGGTDIYCGLGEDNKCSPFALTVLPGDTLASMSEAESLFDPIDNLVEARAGDTGKVYLQAKDAFGNNRMLGGDDISAKFRDSVNPDIQYRGNVVDNGDGTYVVSYSIPLTGDYVVSITMNGEPVQYCVGPNGKRWDSRSYDGMRVYTSPSFCSLDDSLTLNVIHRSIHGLSSTLVDEGLTGFSNAIVGIENGFVIESRDKFGNLRSGSSTSNIAESGDGKSDAFLVTLTSPSGLVTVTSSAVEILTSLDSSVPGYFRVSYGAQLSRDIPHDVSAAAMQTILSSVHGDARSKSVIVDRDVNDAGNYQWRLTFIDHLDLWSENSLTIQPGSYGFSAVADLLTVEKAAAAGRYPIRYTLWEKGTYELSVFSGTTLLSGSSYTVEVTNGLPQASSSFAYGSGLQTGVAGERSSFEVQIRDSRQSEVQSIWASGVVIDFINEIQRLQILSSYGTTFQLTFRGQDTANIGVGVSTLQHLEDSLEALPSIGDILVTSNGASVIETGDIIDIEFLTEHGNLDSMTSTGPDIITTLQAGETPYRKERQSIHCDADGGYAILSFKDSTATIDFDDDMSSIQAKLTTLVGSSVSIVQVDEAISNVCDPSGKHFFVEFPIELGDVTSIGINHDYLQNGSITIHGNGEGQYGAVNGISPIMGYFTLSHEGVSTLPIAVDASAAELKMALESLSSIGSVSVTKDLIGIRRDGSGQNLVAGATSLGSVWSVTFASESEGGCHPGSWDKCPSNIGDVPSLEVDVSLVSFEVGATQQQAAPTIHVFEVKKGSTGNYLVDEDLVEIDFSLVHDAAPDIGIEMSAVHELTCTYTPEAILANDSSGSFDISIRGKLITIDAQATMSQLKNLLRTELDLVDAVSSAGSSYGTVCRFDSDNPVTAVTKLTFSSGESAFPEFIVESMSNVIVTARNPISMADGIQYLGDGLFRVDYTPRVSGLYSSAIKVNDEYLWTDLSFGVMVDPTYASAHHSTHNSDVVAVAGAKQYFDVVLQDRFDNRVTAVSEETSVLVRSIGTPDECNHLDRADEPTVTVEEAEIGSIDGHYKIFYTPFLAGQYQTSVMVRAQGGLLGTYYKNQDFSQPVYGNFQYSKHADDGVAWCVDDYICDSTLLDREIAFSWGFDSPLPSDSSFPMDSFSIMWIGELKPHKTDEYTFIIKLNGGVRLTIGEAVIIDSLDGVNAESISSEAVVLADDTFHPIKVEYAHFTDEATVELLWKSSLMEKQIVPSSALFFTRHVENSPFSVHVLPGDIEPTSVAQGEGLDSCIALDECSFVVHTRDENGNSRFNDGSNPNLQISIIGSAGWAYEGRINSVVKSSSPINIAQITSESNDWQYVGQVDVTHQTFTVTSRINMLGLLSRGDTIVIDGSMNIISSSGTFDDNSIPLLSPYLGPTKSNIALYKASSSCMSGTHTIKYTPEVRGSYLLDVKVPKVAEVQRITSSVLDGSSLGGSFALNYGAMVSSGIRFDFTANELKTALESMEGIDVEVSLYECDDPTVSCSWEVTFTSYLGDVITPMADRDQLIGVGADIRIEEITKGRSSTSISGFPRTIEVSPGERSALWSTARGSGLVMATAGEESVFIIESKDAFGNDQLPTKDANLFAVHVYPEHSEYPYSVVEGTVARTETGTYRVKYIPTASGYHTISAVLSVSEEQQMIETGYNTKARGGTFKMILNKKPSLPIPWDADEDEIVTLLDASFGDTSSFDVEKQSYGLFNYRYIVSFKTMIGDAPPFLIDTSNIIGNNHAWDVTTLSHGQFSHIQVSEPQYEIQQIELSVDNLSSVGGATFSLTFMGRRTEPIPWNVEADDLKTKLEKLATVGDILVSSTVVGGTISRAWTVTFDPFIGSSPKSMLNFGNLPPFDMSDVHESISVTVQTIQNGLSPYRVLVSPAEPSTYNTLAYDYPNIDNFEGLSIGTYKTLSHFYLQTRDEYLNEIPDEPLGDVQIIETSASSNLGGRFEISIFGYTLRFDASAFLSDIEMGLQSVPGVGSITVSSNSAKDEVIGKTAIVTKGLNVLTPSAKLTEFIVGDWIRVGDRNDGQLFSIVAMSDITPYTVSLSSPYLGESDEVATLYQHGSVSNRGGYQYIISFDPTLGDVPALQVDGTLLEGVNANIGVTSCDWNISQELRLHTTGSENVDGYFYLTYRGQQTRLMSTDVTADDLEDAIVSDITPIHTVSVEDERDYPLGGKSWTIHLQIFDDEAELFFAEGYLIKGGSIVSSNFCSTASTNNPLYSVQSVAGRRGSDFVVELTGLSAIQGSVVHEEDGRYLASYMTPRVGEYSLSILGASSGGLTGEYFSSKLMQDEPSTTQVDSAIDFDWSDVSNSTAESGTDKSSIRWTGYIKPSFGEVHTFTIRLNGGVRLWIGNELLIDELEKEIIEQNDDIVKVSGTTSNVLVADRLISIKIEYTRSNADAMIQLLWQSISQPLAVIDSHRLFRDTGHISGSPYEVLPQSIEPTSPQDCGLGISAWNALNITWSNPIDDGGDDVTKFLVESWDTNDYGITEKQQLRLRQTITGGTMSIGMDSLTTRNLPVDASALELEQMLESLTNVGDVLVSKAVEADFVVYEVEFLTNHAPVPVLGVNLDAILPDAEKDEYCVCAKGNIPCHSGSSSLSCDAGFSRVGTVSTSSTELIVGTNIEESVDGSGFVHTISGLEQPSNIMEGFGVRVSAGNDKGYGAPCQSIVLKPFGPPLPPILVEIKRVASSPSSLALYFTSVSYPEDKASVVTGFFVEWSTTEDFLPGTVWDTTVATNDVPSDRLDSYNNVDMEFNLHLIEDLDAGVQYFVRVAAINEAGTGQSAHSSPLSLAPGSKPIDLDNMVALQTLDAVYSSVSVAELCSSLYVSWRAPAKTNGFDVSNYLVEYWVLDGVNEVQEISLSSPAGSLTKGTFTLGYANDITDSLSIDASADDVKVALEQLRSLRSVKVWRSGVNPNYTWTVTFLSEFPSVYGDSLRIVEDYTQLVDTDGATSTIQVSVLTPSSLPIGYTTKVITVDDPLQTHYTLTLTDLTPGQSYHAQVSASNALGYGRPQSSAPYGLSPPIEKPAPPTNVILRVASSQALEVIFAKPKSDGGSEITLYKIEWDTLPEFDSINDAPMGSYSFVPDGCDPCTHQISGLSKGVDYYVRVYAYNSRGYSTECGIPRPTFLSPKTAPEPPTTVHISPQSDTQVHVTFTPSKDDGGAPVSKYKVEWNSMGYHVGMASNNDDSNSLLYSQHNVQSITLTADEDDIGGTFRVAFQDHATDEISVHSTAHDMKLAIESLPTIGSTIVTQKMLTNGAVWSITFLTNVGDDNQFGPIPVLTVSIDPADSLDLFVSDTLGQPSVTLFGTGSRLVVAKEVTAFKGFEQQTLTAQCDSSEGILGGHFTVSVDGVRTNYIPFDVSALDLKEELETLGPIGTIKVLRQGISDRINSFTWKIVFIEHLGNFPLLQVQDHLTCSFGSASIYSSETAHGIMPRIDGVYAGFVEIDAVENAEGNPVVHSVEGLIPGMPYFFQVSAWNGAGDLYGHARYSTPATLVPMDSPDPPTSVEISSIDDTTLRVRWNTSLNKGGSHQITNYRVELAERQLVDCEIQVIELSSSDVIGGSFRLGFAGSWTPYIHVSSSALQLKGAIDALPNIRNVIVETLSSTTNATSWSVTFQNNIGNQPNLLIDDTKLTGSQSTAFVGELVAGKDAKFDYTLDSYLGSYNVDYTPEVQAIILETSAEDMGGYFRLHFMGVSSQKINAESSPLEVKEALERLSTIDTVSVSMISHSIDSTVSYGQKWLITFTSQQGDLPLLLVDTGSGPPSTIATGGSLYGSSPIVRVETVSDGILPTTFVTPSIVSDDKLYVSRVLAFNSHAWGPASICQFAISPSKTAPSPPRNARVNILSDTEIGVTWTEPLYSGGDPIAGYKIQWATDNLFNEASANVGPDSRHFYIQDLDSQKSYFVRVMAFSSQGYSTPMLAHNLLANSQEIEIRLVDTIGGVSMNETFQIKYGSAVSEEISVVATAGEVEEQLWQLIGAVSVDREDRSHAYDSSSIETNYFDILYRIIVLGSEEVTIQILDDNLGSIVGSVHS